MRRLEVSGPAGRAGRSGTMLKGGSVLLIAAAQLMIGLALLGVFEGYKIYFFNSYMASATARQQGTPSGDADAAAQQQMGSFANPLDIRSPMGFCFWLALANNIFAICGLAGVLNSQRQLVISFFVWNSLQCVGLFHFAVDLLTDSRIAYRGAPPGLTGYEKAAAALLCINMVLAGTATVFAMRAIEEIKLKQKEDYSRLTVLGDSLAFEADHP